VRAAVVAIVTVMVVARPAPAAADDCRVPRMLVLQDKTTSSPAARTQQLAVHDFGALIEHVRTGYGGGELAVALIRDTSARPLLRVRIAPPPSALPPFVQLAIVFQAAVAKQRNVQAVTVHQDQMRAWPRVADADVSLFMRDLSALLAQASDAPQTDLIAALNGAVAFVRGPAADPRAATRDVLIAVRDADDNVRAAYIVHSRPL
jgi:uncharacterized protein